MGSKYTKNVYNMDFCTYTYSENTGIFSLVNLSPPHTKGLLYENDMYTMQCRENESVFHYLCIHAKFLTYSSGVKMTLKARKPPMKTTEVMYDIVNSTLGERRRPEGEMQ